MPTITGPILNTAGLPASGQLRARVTQPFDESGRLVSQAVASIDVTNGEPSFSGEPWVQPVPPEGVLLEIEQDLDGEKLFTFFTVVPARESVTYSELLFNRGVNASPGTYWWDLTGGIEFPPQALNGDYGYDSAAGLIWRNEL